MIANRIHFMTALVLSLMAGVANASVTPVLSVADPSCLATLGGRCVLRTERGSIELVLKPGDGIVARLKNARTTGATSADTVLPIQQDLLDRVNREEMTDDEASEIASEVANFDGAIYAIPEITEIRSALGFPADTGLNGEDYRDLVRAHLQITLGVGPITASYLVDRLGVRTLPSEPDEMRASAEIPPNIQPEAQPDALADADSTSIRN